MKNALLMMLALISVMSVSACKTTAEGEGYKVSVEDDDHYNKSNHCPPGHRMKGWC